MAYARLDIQENNGEYTMKIHYAVAHDNDDRKRLYLDHIYTSDFGTGHGYTPHVYDALMFSSKEQAEKNVIGFNEHVVKIEEE